MSVLHLNIKDILNFKKIICTLLVLFVYQAVLSQCAPSGTVLTNYCEYASGVKYLITDENNLQKEFYFDNFSRYTRGITMGGSTILKVAVRTATTAPVGNDCHWSLVMTVDNFGYVGPANYWDNVVTYGTGVDKPDISLFEVRVTNACQTPYKNGEWRHFSTNGESLEIIGSTRADLNPNNALTCTSFGNQVNGPGTFLGPDYNEYTFTIDYRIRPGYDYTPGAYKLKVNFCLTEK